MFGYVLYFFERLVSFLLQCVKQEKKKQKNCSCIHTNTQRSTKVKCQRSYCVWRGFSFCLFDLKHAHIFVNLSIHFLWTCIPFKLNKNQDTCRFKAHTHAQAHTPTNTHIHVSTFQKSITWTFCSSNSGYVISNPTDAPNLT